MWRNMIWFDGAGSSGHGTRALLPKGDKIMNEEHLNLLKDIRNTLEDIQFLLEDIQFLQEDMHGLLDDPGVTLEKLVKIRDTMEDIQGLQEVYISVVLRKSLIGIISGIMSHSFRLHSY